MTHQIKLIALDLDGTLYTSDGIITPHTKDVLKKAITSGITVIISTGRPYVGLPLDDLTELGIQYAITANGASIYQLPDKKCIYENCLDTAISAELLNKLFKIKLHLDAFIDGDAYTQESTRYLIDELQIPESLRTYIRDTRIVVPDLAEFILKDDKTVQKITLNFVSASDGSCPERNAAIALLKQYSHVIHYVSGGFHNLEFNKKNISKAKGLHFLCKYLNIPIAQTMACGDSENDLDIVTASGLGIAMANAEQFLLDAADFISLSNEEDGVAHAIEKFVFQK